MDAAELDAEMDESAISEAEIFEIKAEISEAARRRAQPAAAAAVLAAHAAREPSRPSDHVRRSG